jgi:hypothetical protein
MVMVLEIMILWCKACAVVLAIAGAAVCYCANLLAIDQLGSVFQERERCYFMQI